MADPHVCVSRRSFFAGSLAGVAGIAGIAGIAAAAAPRGVLAEPRPEAPPADPSCVFCQIVAGRREASLVWQDDLCVAFGSIHPLAPGHLLIVPRRHVENLYSLPEAVGAHLFPLAAKLGRTLKTVLRPDGLTLLQNNEKGGGQTVFHFHLHLIPRHVGGTAIQVADTPLATREQLEAALAPVRKALAGG